MEASNKKYDFECSLSRIDEILNASNDSFEESDSIVDRAKLTFTNGFYVHCTALFVDIRDSSNMTDAQIKKDRTAADKLSKKALWSEFIKYYWQAYDFALQKVK